MFGVELHIKIIDDVRWLVALNLNHRSIARALKIDRRSLKNTADPLMVRQYQNR